MRTLVGGLLAAGLLLTGSFAAGQELPHTRPDGGCRSEMDERLAFGLCPDRTFDFYANGPWRENVPRPDQVLGYPLGSWHTTYGRMERYLDRLADAAGDRVRVFDYGRSVEGQIMHLVAISAERHIARLEDVRARLARLADPRQTPESQVGGLLADLPIVVWLNAANDGNETAAFEAAIQLTYQLTAGEDARTRLLRDSALVLINLAHNPESHERMVAWYNAFVMGDPDPAALEHQAPWGMNTNNNHYQFDLNRDALGLTQTETRAVAHAMRRWRPQVFVDLHGQTTQFFFPPAADPINPVYPPQLERWLDTFGRGNAAAFDQFGWSYYTRDVFDLYYPGYWDTYPGLHGATGMTYETDGGGGKGVRWRRDDGTILRFVDGIARHFVASLATVETAARNRTARLRDYHGFFVAGLAKAGSGGPRTVVLAAEGDGQRAARLATTLLRHGIAVSRLRAAGVVSGTDYLTGQRATMRVPAGSYVIDLEQPNGLLAHTLLVPDVVLPERFAREQLTKFARNLRRPPGEREGYDFYDVTAWNLALAAGVRALWSAQALSLDAEPLTISDEAALAPGGWPGDVAVVPAGGVSGRARSAYVWRPGGASAYRLLARLMGEGFHVAVSGRPLVVDGQDFPRGSFIARVDRNDATLHERVGVLAREAGITVHAASSAFPERGPTGTGSEATRTLHPPRLAVLTGEGTNISAYGALWFQLERRIGQPFTALRTGDLDRGSLDRFDVVVLPEGNPGGALGEDGTRTLRDWVERGGTLIAMGGAARWIQNAEFGLSLEEQDTMPPPADTVAAILRQADAAVPGLSLPEPAPGARPADPLPAPGAFLRASMDTLHWITHGYTRDELAIMVRSLPLRPTTAGGNPVRFAAADRLVIAGFTWPDNTARTYTGRPFLTVDRVGQGRIILFAGDPLYRGVFDGPALLLLNAIYLGAPGRAGAESGR